MNRFATAKQQLRKMKHRTLRKTINFGSKVLGSKAYFFINDAFKDERRAVLAGNQAHYSGELDYRHRMLLRRSIHRIEKGLSTPDRRETFAADYIIATVRTWLRLAEDQQGDAGEIQWARDVLLTYFEATAESMNPCVVLARELWKDAIEIKSAEDAILAPFKQRKLVQDSLTFNGLSALAMHRRSIRIFEDREVPRSIVDEAIAIGLTAPSACNRQSFRVVIVQDPVLRVKVASVPMGTVGFADKIPAIAVLIGQHRGYEHYRDRHAVYVDGGLFATGFILALESLGLNSCCINWPELPSREAELKQLIQLAPDERPIMLIAIGYAQDGQLVPRSHKRAVDIIREWI